MVKFGIPQKYHLDRVDWIIANSDFLDQTPHTNFCGYYAAIRLWIKRDFEAFKNFAIQLYLNGTFDFKDINVKVTDDLDGVLTSKRMYPKLPSSSEMLICLSLAKEFKIGPLNGGRYDGYTPHFDRAHGNYLMENLGDENKPWAGMDFRDELNLVNTIGLEVEDYYGNNFITYFRESSINAIVNHSKKNKAMIALVNSHYLNEVRIPNDPIIKSDFGFTERLDIGTHWITIHKIDENNCTFWDYGKSQLSTYHGNIFEIMAGIIIIDK